VSFSDIISFSDKEVHL